MNNTTENIPPPNQQPPAQNQPTVGTDGAVQKKPTIKKPPSEKPPKPQDPEKPFITIVLGETGVGKTYANMKLEIPTYIKDNLAIGKKGRKVIIYDVNNDYEGIRTLKATPDAIMKFVKQSTIEPRRIVGRDEFGRPLDKNKNYENAGMIIRNFINGLIVLDDIDKYAVHSSKQDLISMLMGNRHIGCHVLISHQAWRKMTVTELENVRYLRIHHTLDNISALPEEKQSLLEYPLCKIASLVVEEQYEYATDLYEQGKLNKKQYESHKAFFVYVDVRSKKIKGVSEKAFMRASWKYMAEYPASVDKEIQQMIYLGKLQGSHTSLRKDNPTRQKAMLSLYEKFKRYIR